jgi:hypothetical protein
MTGVGGVNLNFMMTRSPNRAGRRECKRVLDDARDRRRQRNIILSETEIQDDAAVRNWKSKWKGAVSYLLLFWRDSGNGLIFRILVVEDVPKQYVRV